MSIKESKGFNYFMKLLTFSQFNSHNLSTWPPSVRRVTFHILTTLYQCWINFGHTYLGYLGWLGEGLGKCKTRVMEIFSHFWCLPPNHAAKHHRCRQPTCGGGDGAFLSRAARPVRSVAAWPVQFWCTLVLYWSQLFMSFGWVKILLHTWTQNVAVTTVSC